MGIGPERLTITPTTESAQSNEIDDLYGGYRGQSEFRSPKWTTLAFHLRRCHRLLKCLNKYSVGDLRDWCFDFVQSSFARLDVVLF